MKFSSSRPFRAIVLTSCVFSGAAAYVGCSSDDSTTLNFLDGGGEGSVITDSGPGKGAAGGDDGGGACPDGGTDAPNDLRCTGLYSDWAARTVDPSNKAYAPGVILDFDHWAAVPKRG